MVEALIAVVGLAGTVFGVIVLFLALQINERIPVLFTPKAVQNSTGQFKLLVAITVVTVLAVLGAVSEDLLGDVLPAGIPDLMLVAAGFVVLQLLFTSYICGRWMYGVWRRSP